MRLRVRAVKYREAVSTANGCFAITNVELCNESGQLVEMSGWREKAGELAKLVIGAVYEFSGGRALEPRTTLQSPNQNWYRIGMDGVGSQAKFLVSF